MFGSAHARELRHGCLSRELRFTPNPQSAQPAITPPGTLTTGPSDLGRSPGTHPDVRPTRSTGSRATYYQRWGERVYQDGHCHHRNTATRGLHRQSTRSQASPGPSDPYLLPSAPKQPPGSFPGFYRVIIRPHDGGICHVPGWAFSAPPPCYPIPRLIRPGSHHSTS